jgi:predicted amidohydrolase
MRIRCIENRVFAITANRIGREVRGGKELIFTGGSQIVNPLGEVLAQASRNKEETIVIEINSQIARDKKITIYNQLFEDRKPKFYKK